MHVIEKWYYVYIMTNRSKTLYIGITSKLRCGFFNTKQKHSKVLPAAIESTGWSIGSSSRMWTRQLPRETA